jgi:hypothetical protein
MLFSDAFSVFEHQQLAASLFCFNFENSQMVLCISKASLFGVSTSLLGCLIYIVRSCVMQIPFAFPS